MKAMYAGFAAMIVIGVGAYFTLQQMGFSAENATSSASVRLE